MENKPIERPSLARITKAEQKQYQEICDAYATFLTASRTPVECIKTITDFAHNKIKCNTWTTRTTAKDKGFVMTNPDGTNAAIVRFGTAPLEQGVHIIAAHVDSPCLTAKIKPLREKPEGLLLDCYPYGGIYPHHWFDTAVKAVGHCVKKGKTITFEFDGIISDASIHLTAAERLTKKYEEAFNTENLDVFLGFKDKLTFLEHLKKTYGLDEEDFARSFVTIVPDTRPHRISDLYLTGFGQDDKVCSFAQLYALFLAKPKKTAITLFFDREEIGSTGYNGALSKFLERVLDAVILSYGKDYSDMQMRQLYAQSQMISADVDVAYNSADLGFTDEESASKFGDGIIMDRHNGGKNQSAGNNVPMYLVDTYMELFKKHAIEFKVSAIPPKVNTGGGGTIAMYFAHRGISVVDMGIATANMHGKQPLIFLPDLYQMVKGFTVFFESQELNKKE